MPWQYTPYIIPLLIASVISLALAFYAWRRRMTPGATALVVLMLAVAEWSLGYALELGSADLSTKIFWARVQYLGILTLPLAWLAFALQYTGREEWLTRLRTVAILTIEPLVMLLLVWTNDAHHLVWRDIRLDTGGPFLMMTSTPGVWFWVHLAFSGLLILLGTLLLIHAPIRSRHLYRTQAGVLLMGALAPLVANWLFISGLSPWPYLDPTPFAFIMTGLAIAWSLSRFRLLDVVPVARGAVVDGMNDGVVVLDVHDHIVDLNPAAQRMIGRVAEETIGQPVSQVLSGWPDSVERYHDVTEARDEIVLGEGEGQCTYGLRVSPLYDPRKRLIGRLVVLRDVIERKRLENEIRRLDEELELRVAGRTRELAALYHVTAAASEFLDLKRTLEQSLEQVLVTMRCRVGAIQLLDEAGETLHLAVHQGIPPDVVAQIDSTPLNSSFAGWVIEHGEPLLVGDMAGDPRAPRAALVAGFHTYIGVPMRARGRTLGVLSMFEETEQPFSMEKGVLLASIADHVGMAVENARQHQRAVQAAVLEERSRLARELHDAVIQSLYGATLFAEVGRELARTGGMGRLGECLGEFGHTVQQALKEMRRLVYELRPSALEREGLVGALQQRLDAVEGRVGVEARLLVQGTLELPVPVEKELYSIALEALNNALKHAAATSVTVHIRADGEWVELEVVDDGRGFDPGTARDWGGMGLTSMRERAERLGGTLQVVSAPGQRTRVKVSVRTQTYRNSWGLI